MAIALKTGERFEAVGLQGIQRDLVLSDIQFGTPKIPMRLS